MDEGKPGKEAGGFARAKTLTSQERSVIAQKAATARWKNIPKASYSGSIHIGDLDIPCCVLEDGTRLLTQYGFLQAIGRSPRPAAGRGSVVEQTAPFLALDNLKPFVSKDLEHSTRPIVFQTEKGVRAFGYKAELLPQVCDVYLAARAAGDLLPSQMKFAQACEVMMRGLAHVGIVALVDEATGFQNERAKNALAQILEAFIAKELQPWVQTFPTDYYQELFRLRGLSFPRESVKRPQYFGHLTNDIIYKRLAPAVLDGLRRVTPRSEDGRPKAKYFQSLTANAGYPKLREHIGKVIAMMQLSTDYADFKVKLERLLPPYTDQIPLPLGMPNQHDEDDNLGIGI
jgi:P63C domain